MHEISQEFITVLQYLLPGFLCAWVYYGLTPYTKPSEFERLIQALIFTLLVQAMAYPFKLYLTDPSDVSSKDDGLILSVCCAFAVGLIISFFANSDYFHCVIRWMKITNETSYPSEWFGAFQENKNSYVVLHLDDGNRLYGWPTEWPSDPQIGHFRIEQASWLDAKESIETSNLSHILVPATKVRLVEFVNIQASTDKE